MATRILINDRTGTFTDNTSTWLPAGATPEFWQGHQIALQDLDGDNDPDLVILHGAGIGTGNRHALRVLRNNRPTTNSFTDVTTQVLPPLSTNDNDDFRGGALAVRDVNGDGAVDIVVGTSVVGTGQLQDTDNNRIRSTRLFLGTPATLAFRLSKGFLPAFSTDSGEADDVLLGDLAGNPNPTLILLSEVTPTNSTNGEELRTDDWR